MIRNIRHIFNAADLVSLESSILNKLPAPAIMNVSGITLIHMEILGFVPEHDIIYDKSFQGSSSLSSTFSFLGLGMIFRTTGPLDESVTEVRVCGNSSTTFVVL